MRYLILGAGPAGLSFANFLLSGGISDFLVLEKHMEAGGLCRSKLIDGSPLDIGGGHFLDVRRPKVNEFLFQFMPKCEWTLFERNSQIALKDQFIHHPFEANIWEFDIDSQVEYLKSIAKAGCNTGKEMPQRFIEWITWKLGDKIAEDYMIPYNKKMFGNDLNDLGTYWLEKLPDVNFEETLRSCLTHRAYGKQPGHAQFYYPKEYGYGELWKRMADALGENIHYGKNVKGIDFEEHIITTDTGDRYQAQRIINTIPWTEFQDIKGMPNQLKESIYKLKHSSIQVDYYVNNLQTDAHWIYFPDPKLGYHRTLVRHNFCGKSKGYWTETNGSRIHMNDGSCYHYFNEYAYPLNTKGKTQIMQNLLDWGKNHGVYGLGRWGEHQHYNSDVTVERALSLAEEMIKR